MQYFGSSICPRSERMFRAAGVYAALRPADHAQEGGRQRTVPGSGTQEVNERENKRMKYLSFNSLCNHRTWPPTAGEGAKAPRSKGTSLAGVLDRK